MPTGKPHKHPPEVRARVADICRRRRDGDTSLPTKQALAEQMGLSISTIQRYAKGSSQAKKSTDA
jgi:hypothetical protein